MPLRPPTSTHFPTRRSSDLRLRKALRLRRDLDLRADAAQQDEGPRHLLHRLGVRGDRAEHEAGRSRGDRKSTRLNSSHLVISYAVFCLKKKKHTSTSSHTVI